MESFGGSLKNELVHHHQYGTRLEVEASIREYIEIFYDRQQRHSRLGNLAPAVFAQKFSKQNDSHRSAVTWARRAAKTASTSALVLPLPAWAEDLAWLTFYGRKSSSSRD